tara:strand:+ start:261 stop:371 length:111 start_codon:yes stop_codon:yes gene_type:complete
LPLPDKKRFFYEGIKMDIMDALLWFIVIDEEEGFYE